MRFAFRVDSSSRIGFGHVRRCLALGEALALRGASVVFVCRPAPGDINAAIAAAGHQLIELAELPAEAAAGAEHQSADAAATLQALRHSGGAQAIIVDHYELDTAWEWAVQTEIPRCIVIDDQASRRHACEALIDTGPGETRGLAYEPFIPAQALTLTGPRYALLRREFASLRAACRTRGWPVRRVLVNFGGTVAAPFYDSALRAIRDILGAEVEIALVTAQAIAAESALGRLIATDPLIRPQVNLPSLAEQMAAADLAIGAGGNSAWERACLGLPSVMIALADNQAAIVRALTESGAAIGLLDPDAHATALRAALAALAADPRRLVQMSERAYALVDGRGADRLAAILTCPPVAIRRATASDRRSIWEWRNAEFVRAMSHNPAPISWEAHGSWFDGVLSDPARDLLIGEAAGLAVGILRFDIEGALATISIYLTPEGRGKGVGPELLRAGEAWLRRRRPAVEGIRAEILSTNQASIAAFSAARYHRRGDAYYREIRHDAA